jgi:hypothetical protein
VKRLKDDSRAATHFVTGRFLDTYIPLLPFGIAWSSFDGEVCASRAQATKGKKIDACERNENSILLLRD